MTASRSNSTAPNTRARVSGSVPGSHRGRAARMADYWKLSAPQPQPAKPRPHSSPPTASRRPPRSENDMSHGPFPDIPDGGAGSRAVKVASGSLTLAYGSVTARPPGAKYPGCPGRGPSRAAARGPLLASNDPGQEGPAQRTRAACQTAIQTWMLLPSWQQARQHRSVQSAPTSPKRSSGAGGVAGRSDSAALVVQCRLRVGGWGCPLRDYARCCIGNGRLRLRCPHRPSDPRVAGPRSGARHCPVAHQDQGPAWQGQPGQECHGVTGPRSWAARYWAHAPATWRVGMLRRLKRLVVAIDRRSAASPFSS